MATYKRVRGRFFGIRYFPYLKVGIRDFPYLKAGMLDAQNNIKGLSENLGRNSNGNEKPSSRRKHSAH